MSKNNLMTLNSEILIVEDNENSMQLLSDLMTNAGYQIRQAADGEIALVSIRNKIPDLILLDVRLPYMDGFSVCQRLQNNPDTAKIPIIFLTANDDADSRVKGLKMGAVDYLGKPFNQDEVLLRVKTNLELRQLQSRLSDLCYTRTKALEEEIKQRREAEAELRESRHILRDLTGHLQEVREEERANISREIHDQLGQTLTVAKIQLVKALETTKNQPNPVENAIRTTLDVIEQASDIARNISENLRPGMLDVLGLCPTVEHHVNGYTQSTGIECDCDLVENSTHPAPKRVAIAGLRIVQEALTNVAKYANADLVHISVKEDTNKLYLNISDNGEGFDTAKIGQRRCFGLIGMQERVAILQGTLSINSIPGMGTTIEAELPYQ